MVKNNKELRIELLNSYGFYDEVTLDSSFKDHLKLANIICDSPISYISLLDGENQYILSQEGAEFDTIPSKESFCQYTLFKNEALIINDTSKDKRTKDLALVTNEPSVKFYAGIPLNDENNDTLGSFCVVDYKARQLSPQQIEGLTILAKQALTALKRKKTILPILKAHGTDNCTNVDSVSSIENALIGLNKKLIQQHGEILLKTQEQGIGLSSCVKIVEKYDSAIQVTSEVGVGSSFSFHIPCINPPTKAESN